MRWYIPLYHVSAADVLTKKEERERRAVFIFSRVSRVVTVSVCLDATE